jgi:hypothetical protein
MTNARDLTYGIALGAALMALFDPRGGAARRARVRQKAVRAAHEVEAAAGVGARDLEHRAEGIVARFASRLFGKHETVSDEVLVARVRAELGHVCAHPGAIKVIAKGDGCVELKGPILRSELDRVIRAIAHVPGVAAIDDDLEVHAHAADHPALQGPPNRTRTRRSFITRNPASRLFFGLGGAGICVASLVKGNPLALVAGAAMMLGTARSILRRGGDGRRAASSPSVRARGLPETIPRGADWSPVVVEG